MLTPAQKQAYQTYRERLQTLMATPQSRAAHAKSIQTLRDRIANLSALSKASAPAPAPATAAAAKASVNPAITAALGKLAAPAPVSKPAPFKVVWQQAGTPGGLPAAAQAQKNLGDRLRGIAKLTPPPSPRSPNLSNIIKKMGDEFAKKLEASKRGAAPTDAPPGIYTTSTPPTAVQNAGLDIMRQTQQLVARQLQQPNHPLRAQAAQQARQNVEAAQQLGPLAAEAGQQINQAAAGLLDYPNLAQLTRQEIAHYMPEETPADVAAALRPAADAALNSRIADMVRAAGGRPLPGINTPAAQAQMYRDILSRLTASHYQNQLAQRQARLGAAPQYTQNMMNALGMGGRMAQERMQPQLQAMEGRQAAAEGAQAAAAAAAAEPYMPLAQGAAMLAQVAPHMGREEARMAIEPPPVHAPALLAAQALAPVINVLGAGAAQPAGARKKGGHIRKKYATGGGVTNYSPLGSPIAQMQSPQAYNAQVQQYAAPLRRSGLNPLYAMMSDFIGNIDNSGETPAMTSVGRAAAHANKMMEKRHGEEEDKRLEETQLANSIYNSQLANRMKEQERLDEQALKSQQLDLKKQEMREESALRKAQLAKLNRTAEPEIIQGPDKNYYRLNKDNTGKLSFEKIPGIEMGAQGQRALVNPKIYEKSDAKAIEEARSSLTALPALKTNLQELKSLSERLNTGPTVGRIADTSSTLGSWLGVGTADDIDQYRGLTNQIVLDLSNQLKGSTVALGKLKMIERSKPELTKSKGANVRIVNELTDLASLAQKKAEYIAQAIAQGKHAVDAEKEFNQYIDETLKEKKEAHGLTPAAKEKSEANIADKISQIEEEQKRIMAQLGG